MEENEKLFAGFPPVTIADWEAKIKEDLKGADYEKKLIRKTLENISNKPYYTVQDLNSLSYLDKLPGEFPYIRGTKTEGNFWEIRQDFKVTEVETAMAKAQLAAERGLTSIGFDLSSRETTGETDIRQMVSVPDLNAVSINIIPGKQAYSITDFLLRAFDELGISRRSVKGSFEFDPLGNLIKTGNFYHSEAEDFSDFGKILRIMQKELPGMRSVVVNSCYFGDAGSTITQELAFGLSMISEYINRLGDQNFTLKEIIPHIQWNVSTGADYFMEIAKLRAARVLFSALISGYDNSGAASLPVYLHSKSTSWNKTLYDPNVNMLRLTTEAMAAILGGCNSLALRSFDSSYNEPVDFSERLARNIQIILKEESHFDKVSDPSAGSYYVESLTSSLIENAWQLFVKTDAEGGFLKNFMSGKITAEVTESSNKKLELIASRREVLVGTNQYPGNNEKANGCYSEEIAFPIISDDRKIANPLIPRRASQEFEKLRLATEKHTGSVPKVFMLTYGNLTMRLARSQFSSGFFACAGYEIVDNLGFKTAEEGVKAAMDAKADIIVVCSSDDEYLEIAPRVAELVGNKAIVVVAGSPASMEELKQKGITEFIHIRSNILETLKKFHNRLGIQLI